MSDLPELERSNMKIIDGYVDTNTRKYKKNFKLMTELNSQLDKRIADAMEIPDKIKELQK